MKDYKDVTFIKYMKKKIEMLDSLGRTGGDCLGVPCSKCPLNGEDGYADCSELESRNPEKAIEIVMNYGPKIDWTKVPVDAKVLVSFDGLEWFYRHFAKFEDGKVFVFEFGWSSFTAGKRIYNAGGPGFPHNKDSVTNWKYTKLYKED